MKEDFWRFSRGHYFEGECFNGTSLRHLFSGAHKETFKVPFIEPKAEPALMPAWLLPAFLWVSGAAMLLGVFKLNQLVFKYSQLFRPLLEEAEQVKNASDSILNRMSNGAENLNTIGQTLRNTPPVSKTYFDDKVAEIIRVVDSLTERIATNNRYQEESLSNLVRKLENFANVIPALVRHVLKEEKSR